MFLFGKTKKGKKIASPAVGDAAPPPWRASVGNEKRDQCPGSVAALGDRDPVQQISIVGYRREQFSSMDKMFYKTRPSAAPCGTPSMEVYTSMAGV